MNTQKNLCLIFSYFSLQLLPLSAQSSENLLTSLHGKNVVTQKEESALQEKAQAKPTVVLFLSALCPCSDSHIPLIKEMHQNSPQFQFVGIHTNSNENEQMTREYFKKAALPFPVIQDQDAQLADLFKAAKTPHVYLLSTNGQILYEGGITDSALASKAEKNFLQEALNDVKNQHEVKTKEGRTLGCIIMRSKS